MVAQVYIAGQAGVSTGVATRRVSARLLRVDDAFLVDGGSYTLAGTSATVTGFDPIAGTLTTSADIAPGANITVSGDTLARAIVGEAATWEFAEERNPENRTTLQTHAADGGWNRIEITSRTGRLSLSGIWLPAGSISALLPDRIAGVDVEISDGDGWRFRGVVSDHSITEGVGSIQRVDITILADGKVVRYD